MEAIRQLENPVVRDLAWAVFSQDLILPEAIGAQAQEIRSGTLSDLTPARLDWLQSLDRSPQPLLMHVGTGRGQRLGLYFESLWHFFLQSDSRVDLLAHNLPVRDAGRTVGEFDCLYRCRDSGEIVHLELAVKFYLYTGPGSGGTGDNRADWLGPGRRDRLDHKLTHLAEHQTRLSRDPAAQRLLQARGLIPDRVEVNVKGRLFRRPDQPCLPPTGFNPARTLKIWHFADALDALVQEEPEAHCHVILTRQQWLAPLALPGGTSEASTTGPRYRVTRALRDALSEHFAAGRGPLLLASLDTDGRELQRFFVAPSGWPA